MKILKYILKWCNNFRWGSAISAIAEKDIISVFKNKIYFERIMIDCY